MLHANPARQWSVHYLYKLPASPPLPPRPAPHSCLTEAFTGTECVMRCTSIAGATAQVIGTIDGKSVMMLLLR